MKTREEQIQILKQEYVFSIIAGSDFGTKFMYDYLLREIESVRYKPELNYLELCNYIKDIRHKDEK